MFGKYILNNFRKNPLGYILIFLLETVFICVSLVASGIAFNAMTDKDYTQTGAKEITVNLKATTAGEFRETLARFTDELPVPYAEMRIGVSDSRRFSGSYCVWQYPDYETMCKQLTEGIWKMDPGDIPTREQFENGERVAIVGNYAGDHLENGVEMLDKYNFTDDDHIMIAGSEYLVSGRFQSHGVHIFFSTVPDDTSIYDVTIELKTIPNRTTIDQIRRLSADCFDELLRNTKEPNIDRLLYWRDSAANIMLSALVIIMSVFNILLVFNYLMTSRHKYFAVLRLCGYNRWICIAYSFAEIMVFCAASSLTSFVIFRTALIPFFAEYYSVFSDVVFSAGYYAALYGIFLAANVLLFAIYIAPSLLRSVREELTEV